MRRAFIVYLLVGIMGGPGSLRAAPSGANLLAFDVPIAPLSPNINRIACRSYRVVSMVSEPSSRQVKVIDADDPMRWEGRLKGKSLIITTRSGASGEMIVTHKDRETLRAISDEGVAESLALDYRSGRAVFTTVRNLTFAENELLGRVHYMRCEPAPQR